MIFLIFALFDRFPVEPLTKATTGEEIEIAYTTVAITNLAEDLNQLEDPPRQWYNRVRTDFGGTATWFWRHKLTDELPAGYYTLWVRGYRHHKQQPYLYTAWKAQTFNTVPPRSPQGLSIR